ncbi:MAG: hypothetical protein V4582_19050 [Pseudomonadota bacterium]
MIFENKDRKIETAALLAAATCVPLTKVALMFLEYRLHVPMFPLLEGLALILALIAACLIASHSARSLQGKLLRGAAAVSWSVVAYFVVVFMPGCAWAPACV